MDPDDFKDLIDSVKEMEKIKEGTVQPAALTEFIQQDEDVLRRHWDQASGLVTEMLIDQETGRNIDMLETYPGECYWSKTQKAWKIRRKK